MVVHLAVLEGAEIVYLDKIGGRFASGLPSRVGGHAPAHATGVGKAMLAWLEPEQVDTLLPEALPRSTERTITGLPALRQELDRIRRRHGLAFDRGEAIPGVSCAAAPLRGPEGPVAAISLSGDERTARLERVAPSWSTPPERSHAVCSRSGRPYAAAAAGRRSRSAPGRRRSWTG